MRLGELTYLTDQIVTFGFSSLELRNKAWVWFIAIIKHYGSYDIHLVLLKSVFLLNKWDSV